MIEELQLINFRCYRKHRVPFKQNTIIVGENNTGKSTIIEALRIISIIAAKYKSVNYNKPPDWLDIPIGHKGVAPSLKDYDFHFGSVSYRYNKLTAQIKASFTTGESIEVYIGGEEKIFAVIKDKNNNAIKTRSEASATNLPAVLILPEISPLFLEEKRLSKDYVKQNLFSRLSSRHFRNQILIYPERCKKFRELVETSWDGCQIKSINTDGSPGEEKISLIVRDTDFSAEIGWMGHGLQIWLQIMWFLSFTEKDNIVIIDEPDTYMHADLQRKIIRLLLGEQYHQLIVATHSIEIISEVEPENILVVDKTKQISRFTNTIPAVQKIIDNIGAVHNIQLMRLWKCKKCIFVEGDDLIILKPLHKTLFPKAEIPIDIIPNMSLRGWSGWDLATKSSMFLKNNAGEAIYVYCILDSDYYTKYQIEKRLKDAERSGVKLHIWERKEIENYLIVPETISRIINRETNLGIRADESKITEQLEKICNDFYFDTFNRISIQISNENPSEREKANIKAKAIVDEYWKSIDGKLTLVSGKEVLSRLSAWSQAEYHVSLNSTKIAKEMKKEEILPEMKDVIQVIEERRDSI
ncbi:AAA family ATPase [Methanosarcina sp. DH2]|jgi:predicted ATP-dependent endonuclease of OLD family|nr:AAA family ATPase [Methanosarcina sp. DH2]